MATEAAPSGVPSKVFVCGESTTCQGMGDIACEDNQKTPISLFPSLRFILSHLPALLLLDMAIVVALSRSGLLDTPRFESLNVAVLDRVNALLPTINVSIDSFAHLMAASDRKSVGHALAEQGAFVKHPIVMIPGFVSSGLEVWTGKDCAKGFFRQRLWAALSGARTFFVERDCWKDHMMLDPWTGSDPPGIRLRASEGFGATDYFIANYWVWSKLVENLAAVGYTPSNMAMQAYDWRLSFSLLEERDGYFTTLKGRIEAMHKTSGRKVALISHSMGSLVAHHFFRWVTTIEEQGGGGGGKKWVDEHVECFINIAGPHLGVPKAATALLSGEMSDTVLGGPMTSLVEGFFGRRMRRELWSSWGSLWAMLPTGGNALWGPGVDFCLARSSEDPHCPKEKDSFSPLVAMTDKMAHNNSGTFHELGQDGALTAVEQSSSRLNHSIDDVLNFLIQFGNGRGPQTFNSLVHSQSNKGKARGDAWYDATSTPLPHAPSMKIFVFTVQDSQLNARTCTSITGMSKYHSQRADSQNRPWSSIL
jgi:Lecithin:cholesterol acyltransferase